MRVIAGSARSLKLKTLEGIETRPTTDRIKETLFNMISPQMYDCIFLDLFAGSGGIGIEALSRGAKEAVFVEKNPKAMECVKENLKFTRLEKKGLTLTKDVMNALYQLEGEKVFDFVFMDPPYNMGFEKRVLEYLAGSDLILIQYCCSVSLLTVLLIQQKVHNSRLAVRRNVHQHLHPDINLQSPVQSSLHSPPVHPDHNTD